MLGLQWTLDLAPGLKVPGVLHRKVVGEFSLFFSLSDRVTDHAHQNGIQPAELSAIICVYITAAVTGEAHYLFFLRTKKKIK